LFQVDTDSISSPYRPLTQGKINKAQVLSISFTGLIICIAIFSIYNNYNLFWGIISGFGLLTYTTFKRKWWGGPFYNSWIVAVLFLISFYSASGVITIDFSFNFILTISTVFWGYSNFVLSGYFKDISADAATGYDTLPVHFGRRISVIVSDVLAVLAAASSGVIIISKGFIIIPKTALLFYSLGIVLSLISQIKLHKVKTDDEAHPAITLTVHAFILLLSSVTVSYRPSWGILLAFYYLLFNVVMKLRPSKNQV
jgi:4-hydroxybenzoate polyprenyltransferase